MLEIFLKDHGILRAAKRVRLLCVPDYLFFRTHFHKLYREYKGIPRYSIITRKITDELDFEARGQTCSLETLYIVDGSSALTNAPFYFPLAKHLDLSIIGTNLDITELPKLRFMSIKGHIVQKYEPITLVSGEVHYHAPLNESGMESNSVTLPPSFTLFPQPITFTKNTIAVGSVRDMSEFFPSKFDLLRINLGDFVEYNQRFSRSSETAADTKINRKQTIIDGLYKIISCFDIQIVLISFYKIAKFFAISPESIVDQVQSICDNWSFSESILINNEKRRVWEEESMENLEQLYDKNGYIALFNRPKVRESREIYPQDYDNQYTEDNDILQ